MRKDRISMTILESLNNSNNKKALTEMPKRIGIKRKVQAYDYKDLNSRQKELLSGSDRSSASDAKERFKQDAELDLTNRLNKLVPDAFTLRYGTPVRYSDDDYKSDSLGLDIDAKKIAEFLCNKYPELEMVPDANYYGDNYFSINLNGEDPWHNKGKELRKVLSYLTNFDDLRRQSKVAINDYIINLENEIAKTTNEHIGEFTKARGDYSKYTNLSAKEKEDELSKNWYDKYGKVIRAKNLDESFIEECGLKEAKEIDVDDYIEIYNFDELSDWAKERITERRVKAQIQRMFDRMTEILEKDFTEYMANRGLELQPGSFDIEDLLYNMTHEPRQSRWSSSSITHFYVTKAELASYIKNNEDLAEKYGKEELDRLLDFTTTDRGDAQPVYTIYYDGGRGIKIDGNFNFKHYNYDSHKDEYYDKADAKLEKLYNDLKKELSLDFYSSYKILDKDMKQLKQEAKDIVYTKMSKSKDMYLHNGDKFDRSQYNITSEEDAPVENK